MKKLLCLLGIAFIMTGCGNGEVKTMTCNAKNTDLANGYTIESTYTAKYKDGLVEEVETVEVVKSDDDEILDTLKTQTEKLYKTYNDKYKGYTYNITKDKDTVTAKVTINYNDMDIDKFAADNTVLKNYMKKGKITVDGLKAMYEAVGASCN